MVVVVVGSSITVLGLFFVGGVNDNNWLVVVWYIGLITLVVYTG